MRKLAVLFVMLIGIPAYATVRCGGARTAQPLTVNSGQQFTLPVQAIAGALDYDVARSSRWSLLQDTTWLQYGSVSTNTIRPATGEAPAIKDRLYNTAASSQSVYYVVTATNAFGGNEYQPCAQDFLVTVNPDPVLSRDAARAVLPVAGSLRGANGSRYETRLTLLNQWTTTISGRIVFHPTGRSAAADDPSLAYSIDANGTKSWDDVVAAIGTTGLGSLDIIPDRSEFGSYPLPYVRSQVISVAANGGAFGSDVPLVAPGNGYYGAFWTGPAGSPWVLLDDAHGTRRLAIGVRTLSDSVSVVAFLYGADGNLKATVNRQFPADYHEQRPVSEWFGTAVQPLDRIVFGSNHDSAPFLPGGAIFYLAETDNVTNDVTLLVPRDPDVAVAQPVVQCSVGCQLLIP